MGTCQKGQSPTPPRDQARKGWAHQTYPKRGCCIARYYPKGCGAAPWFFFSWLETFSLPDLFGFGYSTFVYSGYRRKSVTANKTAQQINVGITRGGYLCCKRAARYFCSKYTLNVLISPTPARCNFDPLWHTLPTFGQRKRLHGTAAVSPLLPSCGHAVGGRGEETKGLGTILTLPACAVTCVSRWVYDVIIL